MSKLSRVQFDELVSTYRAYHTLDTARSPASVRAALDRIAATMQDAAQCVGELTAGGVDVADETAARAAWRLVNITLQGTSERPMVAGDAIVEILSAWADAAKVARDLVPAKRYTRSALPMVADKLLAARTHEQLKSSSTISGETVAELRAIAKTAGDFVLKNAARDALKAAIKRVREHTEKHAE